jgi:two-component system, cell cycle response regulator DivK
MTKRILVVEDQEDNRRIVRDLLRHAGFEVIEVGDGEQALTATAAQRPDVILMDIQLRFSTAMRRLAVSRQTRC